MDMVSATDGAQATKTGKHAASKRQAWRFYAEAGGTLSAS
jgi:hypothetical protein